MTLSLDEAALVVDRYEPYVTWGVGCHPRKRKAQESFDAQQFGELAERAAIVGEIGLDTGSRVPLELQLQTFRQALAVVAELPRLVSIHSYRATGLVVEELRRRPVAVPVLHWWAGTAKETQEAVALGCYFSIHSAVARHSKFRTRVPPERLLVESDHGVRDPPAAIPCRVEWVEHLVAQQLQLDVNDVRRLVWQNLATIIHGTGTRKLLPEPLAANLAEASLGGERAWHLRRVFVGFQQRREIPMTGRPDLRSPIDDSLAAQDDLETSVALMAKIGACWSPSFSPDGTRIALISNLNGVPQVWTVPTEGGWPELVTALDDQIYSVSWSPDGTWLAFSLAPGGGMNEQVYLVRPDGSDLRRLTDGGKENNWLGAWTHDGRMLTIASNRRSAGAMDAYLVDVESNISRSVTENQGIGYFTDVSRDGKRAVLFRMANRSDNNLYLINLQKGEEALLTRHEGPGSFQDGRFAPDGQTIYLASNMERELIAFCRVVLDENGNPGSIATLAERDDAELQEFDITDDGKTAALLWNIAGRNKLDFFDLTSSKITPGPELPTEIASGLTFSKDGNSLAMVLSGSASPMDIYVYDRKQDCLQQVTRSPHAGIDLARMARPELVHFPAHDGIELGGWLYQTRDFAAPGPIVLSFHGGPEGQERPSFRSNYQALLAQGIAVFAPNVRGSAGFGKTFVNLDNGPRRFSAIRDIKTCVDYVVTLGVADPERIGIMGGSYGGYVTMVGLTEYPELFAAGANLFGIVNFETFFENTEPWMAEISKIQYGDPETEVELLRDLSPIHRLDRVTAATIVLHGANDTNVPVVEAEQVVENLEKRGVSVEYILFPDEGHGFSREPNRIRAAVEVVRWFTEHLAAQ